MAGKLKGFSFKKLAIKHGEKFMLGLVGALVLFSLVGTKWLPYGGHPREITNKVREAEDKLAVKTWPDEQREIYKVPPGESAHELVSSIRHQVDPTPYLFTENFRFSIDETTSPIAEPEFYSVRSLIADADRMVIYVSPEPAMDWYTEDELLAEQEGTDEAAQPSEEDKIPDAFKSPNSGFQQGAYGQYPGGPTTGRNRPGSARGRGGFDASQIDPGMLGILGEFGGSLPIGASQRQRRGAGPAQRRGAGGGPPQTRGAAARGPRGAGGIANLGLGLGLGMGMGEEDYELDEFGALGMGGFGVGGSEGRGLRYIAVRGVFPLREQLKAIKRASNLTSLREAEQLFHIIDFELQRKKMLKDADDPWSAEWEKVDIEVAKEYLREASSFAMEQHEGIVTDAGMTMPLPERAMGIYGKHATHPELEEFKLSDEEMEIETKILDKLLEEHLKMMENQPEELVTKKGFSDLVHDSRSLMTSLRPGGFSGGMGAMGGMAAGMEDFMGEFEDEGGAFGGLGGFGGFGALGGFTGGYGVGGAFRQMEDPLGIIKKLQDAADGDEKKKLLSEHVQKQINAEGEMLLFRYLDFDVEPGATYRYRVRLEVTNPNFGRRSAEAAGLDYVVDGQTRFTDWSEITGPVRVLDDVDYFVEKIETRAGDPMRVQANFTLFQWDPEAGTTVTDRDLEVELGEEIGGVGKPFVLDPAQYRFEIEDYEFQTGDLIVDAAFVDSINPTEHPELQLPRTSRRDTGVSDQVLVVHKDGALSVVDEKSRLEALKRRHEYLGYEQEPYKDIKGAQAQQAGATIGAGMEGMEEFEGLLGGVFDDETMLGGGGRGRGRGIAERRSSRGRNTLRKGYGGAGQFGGNLDF